MQQAGFDVTSIVGEKRLQVWVDLNDQVRLQINHIPRDRFAELIDQATVTSWDRKHQKQETLDNIKFGELLGVEAINDWSGLLFNGKPLPVNDDNKKLLMRKWLDMAKFVAGICTDLERLVQADQETARKNSKTTSGPP
jgi:hypothetical protein